MRVALFRDRDEKVQLSNLKVPGEPTAARTERSDMGGGKMGDRGRFWPVSEAPPMGIRTPQPLPKGPAAGGALGEGLRGPYICPWEVPQRPDRTAKTGLDPIVPPPISLFPV